MEDEFVKSCLYYHGGECPYKDSDIRSVFWFYESVWCEMEKVNDEALDRYEYRYTHSEANRQIQDDVPIRLKALLYNRYCHFVDDEGYDFVKYYNKYLGYKKE